MEAAQVRRLLIRKARRHVEDVVAGIAAFHRRARGVVIHHHPARPVARCEKVVLVDDDESGAALVVVRQNGARVVRPLISVTKLVVLGEVALFQGTVIVAMVILGEAAPFQWRVAATMVAPGEVARFLFQWTIAVTRKVDLKATAEIKVGMHTIRCIDEVEAHNPAAANAGDQVAVAERAKARITVERVAEGVSAVNGSPPIRQHRVDPDRCKPSKMRKELQ